jgi:membrane fusion protein (multidrug efflux system)
VRIRVPNPEHALRPGQFVRVIVPARENANATRVPQRAVTELLGKQSVFVVGPDGKASSREIVAKTRLGNDWVVDKGLAPNELVVVDGISKVRPGAAVKPVLVARESAQTVGASAEAGPAATPANPGAPSTPATAPKAGG